MFRRLLFWMLAAGLATALSLICATAASANVVWGS